MTKSKITLDNILSKGKKVLNGIKEVAGKTILYGSLIAAPYFANAQDDKVYKVPTFSKAIIEGTEIELGGPVFFDTKYISKPADNALGIVLYPFIDTTDIVTWNVRGGVLRDLESKVEYQPKKMQENKILLKTKEESALGVDYNKGETKQGDDPLTDNFDFILGKAVENLRSVNFNGEQDNWYCLYRGHRINKDGKPSPDTKVLDGSKTPFVFVKTSEDPLSSDSKGNVYLHGEIYEMVASGNSKVDGYIFRKDTINGTETNLIYDSLYLDNNIESILESIIKTGNPAHVKEFLTEKVEKDEKPTPTSKEKSNLNGRVKVGIGATYPLGVIASVLGQIKVSENGHLGIEGTYSTSEQNFGNTTSEDGFRKLINLPAEMYFVNTGAEMKENTSIINNFGLNAVFSYKINPTLEAFVKAGVVGQETKTTMESSGEEYMEIGGVKDQASVNKYSESNNTTKKSTPFYVGGGVDYSPLKGKDKGALGNISAFVEIGYNGGDNSGVSGSVGLKYALGRSKKQ